MQITKYNENKITNPIENYEKTPPLSHKKDTPTTNKISYKGTDPKVYYEYYKNRDKEPIKYNKTLTNAIDLVLTRYVIDKCENKLNIREGINSLTEIERNFINEIGGALCNFEKFKSDYQLQEGIRNIFNSPRYNNSSLQKLKTQIETSINSNTPDTEENRLEKQNVKQNNKKDTKDWSRYLIVSKKEKGSSYGFVVKKAISGSISKNVNKKYLDSKYMNIHFYKQDFENEYEIAYGVAKDAHKEDMNFNVFKINLSHRNQQKLLAKDEIERGNFDLQNASKNEYLIYNLFKILDPEKYKDLKERKIEGKNGIIVKLIPTIKRKLQEASSKEIIKCLIESMILELNDIQKSDNYIATNQGFLNIDFGARTDKKIQLVRTGEKITTVEFFIRAIRTRNIETVKACLENIIDIFFPQLLKQLALNSQCGEIIDAMHRAIRDIKNKELIEILNECIDINKYNEMKKICDDFYKNDAGDEYKKFHPIKQSDGYLQLVDAFEISGLKR